MFSSSQLIGTKVLVPKWLIPYSKALNPFANQSLECLWRLHDSRELHVEVLVLIQTFELRIQRRHGSEYV